MSCEIAIIGGGHMGRALAVGIAGNAELGASITVADPIQEQLDGYNNDNIDTTLDNSEAIARSDIAILAVKPQVIKSVVLQHAEELHQKLVISIAAGVPMKHLESWLKQSTSIIHCMPNLPVSVCEGITGIVANQFVTEEQKDLTERIFKSIGDTVVLENDGHIDIVTAVSGSGPAYFFYLMDAMIQAATELGMDKNVATRFATRTALGAARIAVDSTEEPSVLRNKVASPGGTTERALATLDKHRARESIIEAVKSAFTRSTELTASL